MNTHGSFRILSLEVRGGFLDGLQVDLDPHLNCIIGGRGTGKTTIVEFLRYALKVPAQQGQEPRRDIQKLHHQQPPTRLRAQVPGAPRHAALLRP